MRHYYRLSQDFIPWGYIFKGFLSQERQTLKVDSLYQSENEAQKKTLKHCFYSLKICPNSYVLKSPLWVTLFSLHGGLPLHCRVYFPSFYLAQICTSEPVSFAVFNKTLLSPLQKNLIDHYAQKPQTFHLWSSHYKCQSYLFPFPVFCRALNQVFGPEYPFYFLYVQFLRPV